MPKIYRVMKITVNGQVEAAIGEWVKRADGSSIRVTGDDAKGTKCEIERDGIIIKGYLRDKQEMLDEQAAKKVN